MNIDADILALAKRLEDGTAYGSVEQHEAIAWALQAERDKALKNAEHFAALGAESVRKRADAAEKRCAELEAQLKDANYWRERWPREYEALGKQAQERFLELKEARWAARVLADVTTPGFEDTWNDETDAAWKLACTWMRTAREQKPEPREPTDDLVAL